MDSSRELEKHQQKKGTDSFEIFNSIITDDEFSEQEYRRDTRKRIIIIVFSMIVLVMTIVGATIGILIPQKREHSSASTKQDYSIEKACNSTLYPESCVSSLTSLKMTSNNSASNTPEEIFMLSLQVTFNELIKLRSSIPGKLVLSQGNKVITRNALNICKDLVQDAIRQVNMSMSSFQNRQNDKSLNPVISDIRTWLSTAITDQETCLDGLMESKNISHSLQEEMKVKMQNSTEFTSNSLAIISNTYRNFQVPARKRLFEEGLLKEVSLVLYVTAAKDGSGHYRTRSDAGNARPKRSKNTFFKKTIRIKRG